MSGRCKLLALMCVAVVLGATRAESDCRCTRELEPVCDTSTLITHLNPCLAACAGATHTEPGMCTLGDVLGSLGDLLLGGLHGDTSQATPHPLPWEEGRHEGHHEDDNHDDDHDSHRHHGDPDNEDDDDDGGGDDVGGSPSPSPASDSPTRGHSCACPLIFMPVCGDDQVTYPNHCVADCLGIELAHNGSCGSVGDIGGDGDAPGCLCTEMSDPVCGIDGQEYDNACKAGCEGVAIAYEGGCVAGGGCDGCPHVSQPVCGDNGRSYASPCFARCAGGTTNYTWGRCHCACPRIYKPVCGSDGQQYDNECEADCEGVSVVHPGPCAATTHPDGGSSSGGEVDDNDHHTPHDRPCVCNKAYDPVCDVKRLKTYANPCLAKCGGASEVTSGGCRTAAVFDDPASDCHGGRKLSDPVCVLLANGSETVQFDNPCYARAAGVNLTAGDRLQRGPCVATCDVECGISERGSDRTTNTVHGGGGTMSSPSPSPSPSGSTNRTAPDDGGSSDDDDEAAEADDGRPVCCGRMVTGPGEYISKCYARCAAALNTSDLNTCAKGLCASHRAAGMLDSAPCARGGTAAQCFNGNPCRGTNCTALAPAGSRCINLGTCEKFFRLTRLSAVCGTYWMDPSGALVPGCGQLPPETP